jgi:hypothetical protein
LRSAGFDNVPEFIVADRGANAALLNWIDGSPIVDIGAGEISAVLAFVKGLYAVCRSESASTIGPASEACLMPADAAHQIGARARRLAESAPTVVSGLIQACVVPLMERLSAGACDALATTDTPFDAPLALSSLVLSPSDFGLHNALRGRDGNIVWVDFEYFGWDDPVKLVADFLLHPAMDLNASVRRAFVDATATIYRSDRHFLTRLKHMLPLYDLRWCMIMLNAFDPAHHARHLGDVERARRLAAVIGRIERIEAGYRGYGLFD